MRLAYVVQVVAFTVLIFLGLFLGTTAMAVGMPAGFQATASVR